MAEQVGGIYYEVDFDTRKMIAGQREVNRQVEQAALSFNQITSAVKLYFAAIQALNISKLADDIRLLSARVEVAAGSVESGTKAFADLVQISRITQTSLAGNAEVFARLNQAIVQMGGNQRDTLQLTDLLAKAIRVSGASATEAKTAMLQFGQALGSGVLQGDEFRSLMENAPYLMRQLADGIGVPIGALKKLSSEGKLTADVIVNALTKAAAKIDADFKKFPQTIEAAMIVAKDSAALAALKFDEMSGSSAALTGALKGLGEVLNKLADQFGAANGEAGKMGRNDAVGFWARVTRAALSYVVDAADLVWQTLSVLGRNVGFVFTGIGAEIRGIFEQAKAVARGDFEEAVLISGRMQAMAALRRKELDDADAKTLSDRKLWGQQMRESWEQGAGGGRGVVNPDSGGPPSKLKATPNDDEARKLAAKRLAAKVYLEGLVADNKQALDRINAEEQKALTDNERRRTADKNNADIYEKARVAIAGKYSHERAVLEEKNSQQIAELNIAVTTDELAKIAAIREEEFRRAAAQQRLGVISAAEAERARTLATFNAAQAYADLAERSERARSDARIAITKSQEQQIVLVRDEAVRQAEEAYRRGKATFEEMEAAKTRAVQTAIDAQRALEASRDQTKIGTLQLQANTGGTDAQEALIRAQADAQMKAVEQQRLHDLEASQLYADQKVAIEADMNQRIAQMRANANIAALTSTSDALGAMVGVLRNSGHEQSGIYKTLFAAQKAFSIASSIVAIQAGIANAASLPWPANLAAMASVIAATASIVATIQGTSYGGGKQYGGPTSAGTMYRVNEGGRPEMFTAANGAQYMLPTTAGSVTPASAVERGRSQSTTVINQTNNFNGSSGASTKSNMQLAEEAMVLLQRAQRIL